jgi:hypothetical protein
VVTWKPSLWYNDIDGLRFGARFNGRYRNSRLLSLAGWYGPTSSELDGRFSFSNPLGSSTNYQYLFNAFDARLSEQFDSFYLRSRGAFPAEAHYHRPDGGNLRGYFNQPSRAGKNLLAANLELRKAMRLPILGRLLAPVLGNSTMSAFFDGGRLENLRDNSRTLADGGLGITFNKAVPDKWYSFILGTNYTIRLDFPIWVSQPVAKENELKFRYVLSFQPAL